LNHNNKFEKLYINFGSRTKKKFIYIYISTTIASYYYFVAKKKGGCKISLIL
jgi:hypothetical protein